MRYARALTIDGRITAGVLLDDLTLAPISAGLFEPSAQPGPPIPIRRMLAPVEPPNVYAIGRNYRKHAAERGAAVPAEPLVFLKPTTTLIGPEDDIVLPRAAPDQVDFEAELAIVIGRAARNVSEHDAIGHIFGYTCANDVTARDCQNRDQQWTRAKGFDTFCPLGPWIVSADTFQPAAGILRSRLNGTTMQSAGLDALIFSCTTLVSYLSHQFTLLPGTVILTGTPEGIGAARQPPVFLRAGDRIEIEIEGIGLLGNRVAGPR